ncbi:hypothetical protein C8Q78DRAFT_1072082 [Trametes maxima]|nr:hypothetical protein C8Q78DRAFT_1072082 [Trametes maxima]
MSTFEPEHIISLAKLLRGGTKDEQKVFEQKWRDSHRWKSWHKRRTSQSQYMPQLEWQSHVVEYVNWVYGMTKSRAPLKMTHPLLGPRFMPPSYLHALQRNTKSEIHPETAYLKPLTIIHPLYFEDLARCPRCGATGSTVSWAGWTTSGPREVHGLHREETALGLQLRCAHCSETAKAAGTNIKNGEGSSSFSTTNYTFWQNREHWQIPALCFDTRTVRFDN